MKKIGVWKMLYICRLRGFFGKLQILISIINQQNFWESEYLARYWMGFE